MRQDLVIRGDGKVRVGIVVRADVVIDDCGVDGSGIAHFEGVGFSAFASVGEDIGIGARKEE